MRETDSFSQSHGSSTVSRGPCSFDRFRGLRYNCHNIVTTQLLQKCLRLTMTAHEESVDKQICRVITL